jgi:DnaJ family protein C protein 2
VFLKIQEAFSVLSNEQKRRAYDSQLPFDESIPTEEKVVKALTKGPHKFFKLFDPVFKRNARFAVKKPVPELGDMNTPIDQVYRFYDYWIKFESWRDFTGVNAEHNPDHAGSREEKRYMIKENERIAKKLKKREMDRIIELVMLAEKKDPRIAADKEKRKNAKESEKNAKEADSRRRGEELAAAQAWSEQMEQALAAENALPKAEKEKLKKLQSNARNILRKLLRASATQGGGEGEYGVMSAADVETLCASSSLEDLQTMNAALGGAPASKDPSLLRPAGVDAVLDRLRALQGRREQAIEDERLLREARRKDGDDRTARKATPAQRDWQPEALSAVATGVLRYPPGSPNRWLMLSYYLTDRLKPVEPYTPEECMIAAHTLYLSTSAAISSVDSDA